MTDALQIAVATAESYAAALRAHDAEALAALYAPDVIVIDAFLPVTSESAEAWSTNIREWFAGLETTAVTLAEFALSAVDSTADLVCVAGTVRYRDQLPDGTDRNAVTNRLSWVLRRTADDWLIAHEHTSVAVDLESGPVLD